MSADAEARLDAACLGVRNLTTMTNDLLDVSKMEEGKLALQRESCDLTELAREVAGSLSTLDRSRSITVDSAGPVTASCDAGIARRILQNLVSNALKHTPSGSAVRIIATEMGDKVRVSVIDHGAGVPMEARAKIFEKFGAVQARNARSYHSVGLGLAFCKLAVEAHGGRIGVDSNEPNGSVFWFEIGK
jgi:signal transduction histidine kinase